MKKIIVGISGASGAQLGFRMIQALKSCNVEIHLVVTDGAKRTIEAEMGAKAEDFYELADYWYRDDDLAAAISSGSFKTDGMIIVPCSMKTMAALAVGYDDNLLVRAADVCLKEGRKVAVLPREMPMGRAHLKNMLTLSEYGCAIIPPMLTFYNDLPTLEMQMDHVIGKTLMQFDLEYKPFRPWGGV